ncbi:MAG: hypothetical protein K0S45_1759 [Nitrospira sp.]|nr:hypothetical protein [Nitrospira sp.]
MGLRIDITTVARLLMQDGQDMAAVSTTEVRFKTRSLNGWISCPSLLSSRCIMKPSNWRNPSRRAYLPCWLTKSIGL